MARHPTFAFKSANKTRKTRVLFARKPKSMLEVTDCSTSAKIVKKWAICGIKSVRPATQTKDAVLVRLSVLLANQIWDFPAQNMPTSVNSTN